MSNIIKAPLALEDRRLIEHQLIEPSLSFGDDEKNVNVDPEMIEKRLRQKIGQTKKDIEIMLKDAEQKVMQTENDIKEKRAAFQQECEEIKQLEKKKGFDEGFKNGQEEGRATYQTLIEETNRWVKAAERQYNQAVQEAEPQILDLSVQIAETILNQKLGEQNQWLSLVKRALAEVKDQEHFKITVAAKWYPFMNEQKRELAGLIQDSPLFIYADDTFEDNDCLIETPSGQLHASVDSQLKVIRSTLLTLLEEEPL